MRMLVRGEHTALIALYEQPTVSCFYVPSTVIYINLETRILSMSH